MEPSNRNSFFRLFGPDGKPSLPVIPMREFQRTSPALIFVPGEQYSAYINSGLGVGGISLTDGTSTYNIGVGVSGVAYTGGSHSIITFTVPGIPDGIYTMKIGGYNSTAVEVMNNIAEANQFSAFFKFSHNKILGSFYYPYAPANYQQKLRLRVSVKDSQSELDKEVYVPSFGKMRSLRGTSRKYYIFETPDYTDDDHDAAYWMTLHDNIIINDRNFILKPDGSYKSTPDKSTPLSNGEFSMYDNDEFVKFRC